MDPISNQTATSPVQMIILDPSFIKTCTSTTMTDHYEPHPDISFRMIQFMGILWLELLRFLSAVVLVNIIYLNITFDDFKAFFLTIHPDQESLYSDDEVILTKTKTKKTARVIRISRAMMKTTKIALMAMKLKIKIPNPNPKAIAKTWTSPLLEILWSSSLIRWKMLTYPYDGWTKTTISTWTTTSWSTKTKQLLAGLITQFQTARVWKTKLSD